MEIVTNITDSRNTMTEDWIVNLFGPKYTELKRENWIKSNLVLLVYWW